MKSFVSKWVKRYSNTKNVDDMPDRESVQKNDKKRGQSDFTV